METHCWYGPSGLQQQNLRLISLGLPLPFWTWRLQADSCACVWNGSAPVLQHLYMYFNLSKHVMRNCEQVLFVCTHSRGGILHLAQPAT